MTPLCSWIVIEPVRRMMHGKLAMPVGWSPQNDVGTAYTIARVLAIGPEAGRLPSGALVPVPFEVGDWVVVENLCGHPGMAARDDRMPPKTHIVDLDADLFGGTPGKKAAIVPFRIQGLPLVTGDEAAARRVDRVVEIKELEHIRRDSLDAPPDERRTMERLDHERWIEEHEARREGHHRTRRMHPTWDPGGGDGIVAVLEDLDAVLALGADPVEVYEMIGDELGEVEEVHAEVAHAPPPV